MTPLPHSFESKISLRIFYPLKTAQFFEIAQKRPFYDVNDFFLRAFSPSIHGRKIISC